MNSSSSRRRTQKCPVPGYRCKRRTRCNKTERRCSISSEPTRKFSRRCINGSRRQKNEDGCAETNSIKYKRCDNGTRRHKRTKECDEHVVYLFKHRKRILARGRQLRGHTDKSANARVKRHKRFAFAPDAPGAAKPSTPRSPPPRELSVHEDDTTNNHDMNEFDQGDYPDEGNGNAVVEEEPPPRQLSPIAEEEDELTPQAPVVRRKTPKIQNKQPPNTRSSSSRTRSETAKNKKVNYSSNGSTKSRK